MMHIYIYRAPFGGAQHAAGPLPLPSRPFVLASEGPLEWSDRMPELPQKPKSYAEIKRTRTKKELAPGFQAENDVSRHCKHIGYIVEIHVTENNVYHIIYICLESIPHIWIT